MILWALIVVVTIKYVLVLLRADNNGEGGTLSLTALAARALGRRTPFVMLLGVIGAAMFIADFDDHAGDLGAVGGRGSQARRAEVPGLRHPAHHRDPDRAVRACSRAAPRVSLRSSARSWWSGLSRSRCSACCMSPTIRACSRRSIPLRHRVRLDARHDRADHAWRGVPGRHGRRGALRRPRPFRPQADPVRLAWPGAAGAADQLFRPGRAGSRPIPTQSRTRSICWCRRRCCCRWWCSRPRRP